MYTEYNGILNEYALGICISIVLGKRKYINSIVNQSHEIHGVSNGSIIHYLKLVF